MGLLFHIQETRTNFAGFEQLALLHVESASLSFDALELDYSKCQWFDANMAAPLGAVLTSISNNLNDIRFRNLPSGIQDILSRNGFLSQYDFERTVDRYGTVVPYQRVDLTDERFFANYIQKYTQGKGLPAMSPTLRHKFYESIGELFANAVMHSESRLGVFTCGQYFPKKNRFDFCISDAGTGFEGSIRRAFGINVSSLKAMQFCLTEGNTTKKDEPGGLGLKLLKRFIQHNQGRIVIVSKQAYYEFGHGTENVLPLSHPFPGTCINIEINTADSKSYHLRSESIPQS